MRTLVTVLGSTLLAFLVSSAQAFDVPCQSTCRVQPRPLTVARTYPVCFFERRPSDADLELYRQKTMRFMRVYLGSRAKVEFNDNSRWVAGRGYAGGHLALRAVWPRVGCVGHYISQNQYTDYRRCVVYLKSMLAKSNLNLVGQQSEGDGIAGQLFCDGNN